MPEVTPCSQQVVLGFDFGARRIGVAVGQGLTGRATPLRVLPARDGIADWAQFDRLIAEWQPGSLLVGEPLNMDGSASEMTLRARKFANRLRERYRLPVHLVDERLSSFEARGRQLERRRQQRPPRSNEPGIDAQAACLIVETFLHEASMARRQGADINLEQSNG